MYYHVWFVTKYRKPILTGKIDKRVKEIFEECIHNHGYRVLEFETNLDHVHMLICVTNKDELSSVLRTMKAVSAKEVCKTPRFRVGNKFSGLWARRYGWREIDENEVENMRRYIRNQR